jgi:3-phenylpropionate/trans-cinnamate dioxygenase ferredoxin reductase subunit
MAADEVFIIVGASLCGAKAAEVLREEGFDGKILLIGAEHVRPYERPPLSKTYLRRESTFDDAAVHDAEYYDAHDIELRTATTVTRLDPMASAVELTSGERIRYDRLLLATGAAPRQLSVPGSDLEGILYLRTVENSDAIHDAVTSSVPVVVIGAGWIGSEVAASARELGAEVTLIDVASVPLERVMGAEVGGVYRDLHAAHGVQLRLGVGIESIGGTKVVEEVRLSDGSAVPAGVVVVGVGVAPRTDLAEQCGIQVENGVMTDEYLATTAPGVYAAGDVANAFHPLYDRRIRLEHWSAALNQGPAAARNMLGKATAYDRTPYFYSDQYELGMEYRGWAPEFDEVVFRGDPASGEFLSFWLHRGRAVAAMNANVWDQSEAIDALVRACPTVEPARLADPDVELAAIVAGG